MRTPGATENDRPSACPGRGRVLPQDDHAHLIGRCQLQRAQRLGRKDHGAGFQALVQKGQQLLARGTREEVLDQGLPVGRNGPVGGIGGLSWSACAGAIASS